MKKKEHIQKKKHNEEKTGQTIDEVLNNEEIISKKI